jgi:uncharacterized protein YggU (UPF0235/DUF167 family)
VTDQVEIVVRVTARAAADAVGGTDDDGVLHVRVHAAPVDGAANVALCRLLASDLGVRSSAVKVIRGTSARRKVIRIDGLDADRVTARWPGVRMVVRSGG